MEKQKNFSLSLSGGGFRASLFHIGALMKLSETGLLQKVTSISTVSGGSILGMLYYLHLKHLLETEEQVSQKDVVDVVKKVKKEFWKVMEKNIVMLPFKKKFLDLFNASISPDYTRTNVLAQVYEEEIYGSIWKKIVSYWKSQKNRPQEWEDVEKDEKPYLYRLKIYPKAVFKDEVKNFQKFDYKKDYNDLDFPVKIPDLIINATNLNTGNLWRFSATKCGEYLSITDVFQNKEIKKIFFQNCSEKEIYKLRSIFGIEKLLEILIDKQKLEYFYKTHNLKEFSSLEDFEKSLINFFKELNKFIECHLYHFFENESCVGLEEEQRKSITIGDAVASSACVPGIFAPFVFNEEKFGKYKKIYNLNKLLLVDGGVYDNQGLESIERKFTKYKIKERKEKGLGLVFCSDASGQMNVEEVGMRAVNVVSRSSSVMGTRLRNLTINKLYNEKNKGSLKFALIHLKQYVKKPVKDLQPPLTFDEKIAELNSRLRTQLNTFWKEEKISLISHGYVLSEYFLYKFFKDEITEISHDFRKEIYEYINEINESKEKFEKILKLGQATFSTIKIVLYKKFGIG